MGRDHVGDLAGLAAPDLLEIAGRGEVQRLAVAPRERPAQEGHRYAVRGDIQELDVPETLHALVAARLDGLDAGERSLLQAAAVLGQSFFAAGLAELVERPQADVDQDLFRDEPMKQSL